MTPFCNLFMERPSCFGDMRVKLLAILPSVLTACAKDIMVVYSVNKISFTVTHEAMEEYS